MEPLNISGKWEGRYSEVVDGHAKAGSQPFTMELVIVRESSYLGDVSVAFEGTVESFPDNTGRGVKAIVLGSTDNHNITFVKQYSKLMMSNADGEVVLYDQLHPEILYSGKFTNNSFFGHWKIHETFRQVNGEVLHLRAMEGIWWMKKG